MHYLLIIIGLEIFIYQFLMALRSENETELAFFPINKDFKQLRHFPWCLCHVPVFVFLKHIYISIWYVQLSFYVPHYTLPKTLQSSAFLLIIGFHNKSHAVGLDDWASFELRILLVFDFAFDRKVPDGVACIIVDLLVVVEMIFLNFVSFELFGWFGEIDVGWEGRIKNLGADLYFFFSLFEFKHLFSLNLFVFAHEMTNYFKICKKINFNIWSIILNLAKMK